MAGEVRTESVPSPVRRGQSPWGQDGAYWLLCDDDMGSGPAGPSGTHL